MRIISKILHTVSAAGLIGGLAVYMVLLITAPADLSAYAGVRSSISVISNKVIIPSLAVALLTGLVSMMVHRPFLDKGWALSKFALGILMFKGILGIVGDKAAQGVRMSEKIAAGEATQADLARALSGEWVALWAVMAVLVVNVVLGVWRPRMVRFRAHPTRAVPAEPAVKPESNPLHSPATARKSRGSEDALDIAAE